MARLNDDHFPDAEVHASNYILSPQPCAPPSKEFLIASLETAHLPSEAGSTIDDGQMSILSYEYSSSGSSTRPSTSDIFGREMDEELEQMKSRASSRSSLSSVPASVLVHPLDQIKHIPAMSMHARGNGCSIEDDEANFGGFDGLPQSIRTIRQREAAFRKPSSVRAMQMHTEDEADDDEFLTPPRRRPGMRSPGTSPLKRSPHYSPKASQSKQSVKKEYPLVLLHCTLLAPSLPVPDAAELRYQKIVEEVLPVQYWKRWCRLQEKVGSGVLRDRGVLISHPEDLYDMLEERLLESLELQRPRVHQGHFLGHEESGPVSEGETSDRGESETDGEQGNECPDCGGHVLYHDDSNRKWEIRVYAANGLMRAGAWAAAWKEMEKVDVEVGLWLPSDVRRALEKRLAEERAAMPTEETHPTMAFNDAAKLDIDPRRLSVQTHSRTFSDTGSFRAGDHPIEPHFGDRGPGFLAAKQEKQEHEIALRTLLINYVRVLAGDRRNVALVFMSILVVFLAIGSGPPQQQLQNVLHSFTHETFQSTPAPRVNVNINPPALSVASSCTGLVESTVPTSSLMASMPISESGIPFFTEEIVSSTTAAEVETEFLEPEPFPEATPLEELPGESQEEVHLEPVEVAEAIHVPEAPIEPAEEYHEAWPEPLPAEEQ
ncbi:uncharacterized protein N7482_006161 [Penicillium canariense]|uniref:Pathway-specific nitrogen regulator n=1 Tax=Penicillium canariense TaxID=189055 RepID=A0A9W9LNV4_9EURO|nr:uncharacterized protein N7482_006161 [Penicillium canariense]KAJ5167380.1 hypothetical protein N7482_006161 [Penicillium canariense]